MEMGCLQNRHSPPSLIHPKTGMLSYHLSGLLHLGQCDGGCDNPSIVFSSGPNTERSFGSCSICGKRQTTTFKKLPTHAPSAKTKRMKIRWGSIRFAICNLQFAIGNQTRRGPVAIANC